MTDLPAPRPRVVGLPMAREDALRRLNEAYVANLIELDEMESRVAAVQHARTLDEVERELSDLPAEPERAAESVSCELGSKKVTGPLLSARRVEARVSMGTLKLDYRYTPLPEGVLDLDLDVHLSTCKIWVPEGCAIENRMTEHLSTFKEFMRPTDKPIRTILRLSGKVNLGTVKIYQGTFWNRLTRR